VILTFFLTYPHFVNAIGSIIKVFTRGINRKMENLVYEIRYNNFELAPDEIIDEINGLLFK